MRRRRNKDRWELRAERDRILRKRFDAILRRVLVHPLTGTQPHIIVDPTYKGLSRRSLQFFEELTYPRGADIGSTGLHEQVLKAFEEYIDAIEKANSAFLFSVREIRDHGISLDAEQFESADRLQVQVGRENGNH